MEDINKKCGNIRHDSYSIESACNRRGVNVPACFVEERRTVSKPDAASQDNRFSLFTGHLNFVSVGESRGESTTFQKNVSLKDNVLDRDIFFLWSITHKCGLSIPSGIFYKCKTTSV